MSIRRSDAATTYDVHGSRFSSYVAPSLGSEQLCAWRLDVAAGAEGVAHRPTREEVLLVLSGSLVVTLDGQRSVLVPGDVVLVPAGSELRVDGGPEGAAVWATSTPGLVAVLPDGAELTPPWTL